MEIAMKMTLTWDWEEDFKIFTNFISISVLSFPNFQYIVHYLYRTFPCYIVH